MYELIRDVILPVAMLLIGVVSIISALTNKKLKDKTSEKIRGIVMGIIVIVGGVVLLLI